MNVSSLKTAIWVATLGAGAALGQQVYQFQIDTESPRHRVALRQTRVPVEVQTAALEVPKPPAPKVDRVDYERVKTTFHALNWTGKEAPPPPPPPSDPGPAAKVYKPARDLLHVLYVQVDTTVREQSRATVRYTLPALAQKRTSATGQETLREGDHLPDPEQSLRVERIAPEGVYFVREGAGAEGADGEPELVAPPTPFTKGIVVVGPGGARMPAVTMIPQATLGAFQAAAPLYSVETGPNRWELGTEDALYVAENYLDILSREVRHRRWRDPRTGRFSGIEIQSVAPGSLPAKFGLQEGDIVIAVNDHPVSSPQEAIDYAKNNADLYDTWVVTVISNGKEKNITVTEP